MISVSHYSLTPIRKEIQNTHPGVLRGERLQNSCLCLCPHWKALSSLWVRWFKRPSGVLKGERLQNSHLWFCPLYKKTKFPIRQVVQNTPGILKGERLQNSHLWCCPLWQKKKTPKFLMSKVVQNTSWREKDYKTLICDFGLKKLSSL